MAYGVVCQGRKTAEPIGDGSGRHRVGFGLGYREDARPFRKEIAHAAAAFCGFGGSIPRELLPLVFPSTDPRVAVLYRDHVEA